MQISSNNDPNKDLLKLTEQAESAGELALPFGEELVASMIPAEVPQKKRPFGLSKGEFEIGPEFFEPLPDDELEAWGQ
jgi:hypothetical protein